MTGIAKLLERARSRKPIKYRELVKLLEAAGFEQLPQRGTSHTIFKHPALTGHVNIQRDGSEAKPYQVKQFLVMIDEAGIKPTD